MRSIVPGLIFVCADLEALGPPSRANGVALFAQSDDAISGGLCRS